MSGKLNPRDLEDRRLAAAQEEYENYDFDPENVTDHSGFEWSSNEDRISRTIFFESTESENEGSLLGSFAVEFKRDSAEIVDAYALLAGNEVGRRQGTSPAPKP